MITPALLDLIHSRGHWEALEDDEANLMYECVLALPVGSHIVEIGCQVGRSSILLLTLAKKWSLHVTFIDPWESDPQFALEWFEGMREVKYPFTLHCQRSQRVEVCQPIDLLYVDGDHMWESVSADCDHYLRHVSQGGYALFHDYGRPSLPDVQKAVDLYMAEAWVQVGKARTMVAYRRK